LFAVGAQPRGQSFRVDPGAPWRLERLDGRAPHLRDRGDALAENAGRAREDSVARAEHVRHRRLEAALPDAPSNKTSPLVARIDCMRSAMLCSRRAYSGPR